MKKILIIIFICTVCVACGKKSSPEYKYSELDSKKIYS